MKSDQINELATALAKAQSEIKSAEMDKINPHFKSSYSSLDAIWKSCREPLSKNGLCVIQVMDTVTEQLVLVTTLVHSSGQWIKSVLPVINAKATPQALGSALTYCRRYALASMVGVTSNEDDDANEAQKHIPEKKQEMKPSTISKQQSQEFQLIISNCQPEYIKWLTDEMKKSGFNGVENLPLEWYDNILKQTIENRDAYQARVRAQNGPGRTLEQGN